MNTARRHVVIVRAVIALSILLFTAALGFRVLAEHADAFEQSQRYAMIHWTLLGVTGLILAGLFIYQVRRLRGGDGPEIGE